LALRASECGASVFRLPQQMTWREPAESMGRSGAGFCPLADEVQFFFAPHAEGCVVCSYDKPQYVKLVGLWAALLGARHESDESCGVAF
ncbi:MAG: hypothetical protein ACREM6_04950, partial [Vulcanimicrobiaceae bacterium]